MTVYKVHDKEYREEDNPRLKKEVVAFLNTNGGTIYIGVKDDGTVNGVDNPADTILHIRNDLKESIVPDILPFVEINKIEIEGKNVIEILVSTGTSRPYYLKEKGLKPSGVYVRRGSSCQPMTDEGIREMIIQNSGPSYESCRSLKQELTFETLNYEAQRRGMELGEAQMRTLNLIGEDGLYTNLALLFSDQCESTTKVAIFQGTDKEIFRERREFQGSILKQMEDVYQFIDLNNKTKATFSGLNRIDTRDYPEEAVREAWLNCLVHRDYSFSGSTIINIYDDRIEFVTLGGLVPPLTLESIFLGVSQSRNPKLAALFYRMKLIESYGTGIGKIRRSYRGLEIEPKFETAPGVFRVTLPNSNESHEAKPRSREEKKLDSFEEEKAMILNYVSKNGSVTRKQVEELVGAATTKACKILQETCESGELKAEGNGKKRKYVLY